MVIELLGVKAGSKMSLMAHYHCAQQSGTFLKNKHLRVSTLKNSKKATKFPATTHEISTELSFHLGENTNIILKHISCFDLKLRNNADLIWVDIFQEINKREGHLFR